MMYLFRRYRLASVLHLLGLSVALAGSDGALFIE